LYLLKRLRVNMPNPAIIANSITLIRARRKWRLAILFIDAFLPSSWPLSPRNALLFYGTLRCGRMLWSEAGVRGSFAARVGSDRI
jgi:hypothetical protein